MIKFEDKMARLDDIVAKLEKNQVALDEAIQLFEEGLQLAEALDSQLKQYENKINALSHTKETPNV